jgi:hypothetical protein
VAQNDWDGEDRRSVNWREITDHMATTNIILSQLVEKVGKQNGRILKLENWRWFVIGACAVVTVLIDIVIRK